MLQIRVERWDQIWPECEPLMRRQAEEIYGKREKPLIIDYKTIHWLEANGGLLILSARENEKLVGYITWIVGPDLESAGRKVATAGPWYVLEEYRSCGAGQELMLHSERELVKIRIRELRAHAPAGKKLLYRWFESHDWIPQQMQYTKTLG